MDLKKLIIGIGIITIVTLFFNSDNKLKKDNTPSSEKIPYQQWGILNLGQEIEGVQGIEVWTGGQVPCPNKYWKITPKNRLEGARINTDFGKCNSAPVLLKEKRKLMI